MIKHLLLKAYSLMCACALCLIFLISPLSRGHTQNIKLIVAPGANFIAANKLVLNNTDISSSGTFDAANANVFFTGASNTAISCTMPPVFNVFTLNKSGAAKVTLNSDIHISTAVNFSNGLVELNGKTLALNGSAILQNETETARITGIAGGSVTAGATVVNNPSQLNVGNLGATITTSQNLGNTTISRVHKPVVNPGNSALTGIDRTYLVSPANNTALNATLRFYYFDAELNGKNENTLSLWSSADGVSWVNSGVTSASTANNYVEKTGLTGLSYFTLSDANNVLPVTLVFFKVTCQGKYALTEWQTGSEINVGYFIIQRSIDGGAWTEIDSVPAMNIANGASYSYRDNDAMATAFYRLKTVDKSGQFSFSPVFRGGCEDIAMPFIVYPNPAHTQAEAHISVRQATKAVIQIFSLSGQQVFKADWQLVPGSNTYKLPANMLAQGSYMIKVLVNNAILKTQLIKQ